MKDRKFRIITSVIILVPMIVGLLLWNVLPERLPTHWGMGGQADGWGSKAFGIFVIPLIMLCAHWLCIWSVKWDRRNQGGNEKVMKTVLLIFPVMSVITMAMVYGTALGYQLSMGSTILVFTGLLFVAIGNYLPKCRQNSTLGIKLPWTLYNEENWNRTHRFGGKVWVAGGILFMAAAFVPEDWFGFVLLGLVLVLAAVPTLYSWLLYKKQVRAGTWVQSEGSKAFQTQTKWAAAIGTGVALAAAVLVVVVLFTGSIETVFTEDYLKIEASYWDDRIIYYEEIDTAQYRQEPVPGSREWGFASPRLLMGLFRNEEFGNYTRYTYGGSGPCIVVRSGENILVLGGKTPEETKQIYETLMERVG